MKKLFIIMLSVLLVIPAGFSNIVAEEELPTIAQLDDRAFSEPEKMVEPATQPVSTSAIFGEYEGKTAVFTLLNSGGFNVVDATSGEVLHSERVEENVTSAWGHTISPNGTVYIVSLGGTNTALWKFGKDADKIEMIGSLPSNDQGWSITADENDNAYIGTYVKGGTKVYKFDNATKKVIDLEIPMEEDYEYVRSITYYKGKLFLGTGLKGAIFSYDLESKELVKLSGHLAEKFDKPEDSMTFAYDMAIIDDILITRIDTDDKTGVQALVFYDLINEKWFDTIHKRVNEEGVDPYGAFGFNQFKSIEGKTIVTYQRSIHELDLNTLELRPTGMKFPSGFRGMGVVDRGEGPVFATIARNGAFKYFDINKDEDLTEVSQMKGLPLSLHNLGKSNDGKLFVTSYPGGPKGAMFDPVTNESVEYPQGQAEGIVAGNGDDLYFGMYPGAKIYKMNAKTQETELLFDLSTDHNQDRPYIMEFIDGLLIIGTIPNYGALGGSLAFYNPETKDLKVYDNVIENEQIVGIVKHGDYIIGSTTIHGGLNINPKSEMASIFKWSIKDEKVVEKIYASQLGLKDLDKPPLISGLRKDDQGLIWGAVDGHLFALDGDTMKILKSKNLFPNTKNRGLWRPVHIQFGEDGYLYTDIAGNLAVVDYKDENLEHVHLSKGVKEVDWMQLAKDETGKEQIYYIENGSTFINKISVIDKDPIGTAIDKEVAVEITNPSFEELANKAYSDDSKIPGWQSLFSEVTANVGFEISSERASDGKHSLKMWDNSATETVFVVSDPIPVTPGVEYKAEVDLYMTGMGSTFMVRFFDEDANQTHKDRDGHNIIHVRTKQNQWQKVSTKYEAPEGTAYMTIAVGTSAFFETPSSYWDNFKVSYIERTFETNKRVLNSMINKVELLDLELYSEESTQVLESILPLAKEYMRTDTNSQDDINKLTNILKEAYASVELLDYKDLDEAMSILDNLDLKFYPKEVISEIEKLLADAQIYRNGKGRSQKTVDKHTISILSFALKNLKELDISALKALINVAQEMDLSNFTQESVTLFKAALENALTVLENPEQSQVKIESAISDLKDAIKNLRTVDGQDINVEENNEQDKEDNNEDDKDKDRDEENGEVNYNNEEVDTEKEDVDKKGNGKLPSTGVGYPLTVTLGSLLSITGLFVHKKKKKF